MWQSQESREKTRKGADWAVHRPSPPLGTSPELAPPPSLLPWPAAIRFVLGSGRGSGSDHFMRIQIRILLLIVVMEIGDDWSTDPQRPPRPIVRAHGPSWLHFEPIKLLNFYFSAELDPVLTFHSNTDPDPQPWFCFMVGMAPHSISSINTEILLFGPYRSHFLSKKSLKSS
jgi:hypothetical protein